MCKVKISHCTSTICLPNHKLTLTIFPTWMGRVRHQRWVKGWWLQDCLLEFALLFGGPSRSGVFLDGKLICNQFLLQESADKVFLLAAIVQLISLWMQKPYQQAWRSSFWTRLFTEVPEDYFQLWSWVSLSFGIIHPNLSIVFCSIIFIGAIMRPRIDQTLERGTGRLYPYLTSFAIGCLRVTSFCKAPLWFPNVSVSTKSCCRSFLLISTNGHLLP